VDKRYWHVLDTLINPLGFGCWQLAGEHDVDGKPHGWGVVAETDAVRLIHKALDNGIRFFDTAAGYGAGKSEEILGKALQQSSFGDAAVVCTKIALTDKEVREAKIGADFPVKVNDGLRRLRRERIDILLLHNPPDNLDWRSFDADVLTALQADGKIGTFGISSRAIKGAVAAVEMRFGSCVEWVFNILERRPITELLPKLQNARMNFIARSPLSRGLLSPSYLTTQPAFKPTDFRSSLPEDWVSWVVDSIRGLDLAEDARPYLSQLALYWCLNHDVSVVIPGLKTIRQMLEFLAPRFSADAFRSFVHSVDVQTERCYPPWA
jgi:aryl-alcohol dehydrogenase-like predicted oxidoreductase